MSEEQTLVPQLRFKGCETPWKPNTIENVSAKVTDGTHDTPKPTDEGVPYLTAIHVKNGSVSYHSCYYLPQEEHSKIYSRCNPEYGDLLMVNIGAGTANSAMVTVEFEFSLKNVALIKPNKQLISPSFLAQTQVMNSPRLRHQLSSGGAQPFLSLKAIKKLKLNTPTLPEQEKIAAFLSSVDSRIEQLQHKKSLLQDYKKGVMQRLFSQQLRFKDQNGNNYPDWQEKKLGEISDVRDGTHDTPKYVTEGYPLVTSKNLSKNGKLTWENIDHISESDYIEINRRSKVDTGDILFGMIGTIGNPVLLREDGFAIKNVALIKELGGLTNKYLIHFLSNESIARQFHEQNFPYF